MKIDSDQNARRKLAKAGMQFSAAVVAGAVKRPPRPHQRLIFTVTNGRSGSDMLHTLFSAFRGVETRHEPEPNFRHFRPYVASSPALARLWLKNVKLPAIASLPGDVYVETSHMFCKGYIEPMLELEQPFDLIFLERPAREIALSMVKLTAIPGSGPWANSFYVSPSEKNFLGAIPHQTYSPYQICYWHALENEARQARYKELAQQAGMLAVTISTAELSDGTAVRKLFADLNLNQDNLSHERLDELLPRKVNQKLKIKKTVEIDMSRVEAEEQVVRDHVGRSRGYFQ